MEHLMLYIGRESSPKIYIQAQRIHSSDDLLPLLPYWQQHGRRKQEQPRNPVGRKGLKNKIIFFNLCPENRGITGIEYRT